jgi:hypothetical protein
LQFRKDHPGSLCVGVERDKSAVAEARRALKALGPDVVYRCEAGELFNYAKAQLMFMANMVSSKRRVLNQIGNTAAPGTYVVVRAPRWFGGVVCETAEYRDTGRPSLEREHDSMH